MARFTIILTDTRDNPPTEIRLRRLLKLALRYFGFRAEIVPNDPTPPAPPRVATEPWPSRPRPRFQVKQGREER